MVAIASMLLSEKETTIEWLPIDKIEIDRSYQRNPGPEKIKLISSNFNENALGVLLVNLRENGQLFIIDGQHRLLAAKKRGKTLVQCKVCYGLTVQEEAKLYKYCNTVRKNPESLDVFRARLVEGDPVAVAINNTVQKCGLSIGFIPSGGGVHKRKPGEIWAVTALEDLYMKGKEELLTYILTIIAQSWPDDGSAFEYKVIWGLADFHFRYEGRYSRQELIAKLQITDLNSLRRRAQYHSENGGGAARKTFARVIQEAYDWHRRSKRLEPAS